LRKRDSGSNSSSSRPCAHPPPHTLSLLLHTRVFHQPFVLVLQKGVFTLKELVKLASKEKGIVAQTVEEVLKSLVDDGEVMADKIGTSNYFWCFPSQELVLVCLVSRSLHPPVFTHTSTYSAGTRPRR